MSLRLTNIFLLAFLVFFVTFSIAQTDSLATKSFKELEDLYIASYTDSKKAKPYVDALYLVALKGANQQRIAKALYRKGNIYCGLSDFDQALEFIEKSLKISHELQHQELLLQNYSLKGNIFYLLGRYEQAITYYLKAKEIAKKQNVLSDVLIMSYKIGTIKKQIEDFSGAIEDFGQNLIKIKKENSAKYDQLEAQNCLGIGDVYLRMENSDSAMVYTERGLQKSSPKMYPETYIDLVINKAIVFFQKKQYDKSLYLLASLDTSLKKFDSERKFAIPYLYRGKNYVALQKPDSAIIYFEKLKTLTTAGDFSFPSMEEAYYQLIKIYSKKGNLKKANEHFELLEAFRKLTSRRNKKTNSLIKEYDITALKKELQILNEQNDQQKKVVFYLYIIAGALLFCILIFLILYKRKQLKTKERFDALLAHIETIEKPKDHAPSVKQKTELAINDEGVVHLLKELEKFEKKQYFLHVDCNLSYAAKKLKTNTAYLSHVINTYKEKSFTSYLTELRINTALVELKNNEKLQRYSMEAIAGEFGFKRRETFSKAFKNITGMGPSMYIKELQKTTGNTGGNL